MRPSPERVDVPNRIVTESAALGSETTYSQFEVRRGTQDPTLKERVVGTDLMVRTGASGDRQEVEGERAFPELSGGK